MFKHWEKNRELFRYDTNDQNLTDLQPRLFMLSLNLCPRALRIVMCYGLISCHTSLWLKQSEKSVIMRQLGEKEVIKGWAVCQEDLRSGVMG